MLLNYTPIVTPAGQKKGRGVKHLCLHESLLTGSVIFFFYPLQQALQALSRKEAMSLVQE